MKLDTRGSQWVRSVVQAVFRTYILLAATQVVSDLEGRFTMKRTFKFLVVFALATMIAYSQMASNTDAQNQAIVDAFIQQNPNLPGIVALAYGVPSGDDITPTSDGNYIWQVRDRSGAVQSFETFGQSTILADLAGSILADADPAQQLALYQTFYLEYVNLYSQLCGGPSASVENGVCANLALPSSLISPSALLNASLGTIKGALDGLTSQSIQLINLGPVSGGLGGPFASCSAEQGASVLATNATFHNSDPPGQLVFGDMTDSSCTKPSTFGIVKNFAWQNENLLTCIREQAGRGSCQKFAAVSALEEVIARDTGNLVNLSEQDFDEHQNESVPAWTFDHGNPKIALDNAQLHSYQFAWESQWDYNPQYGSKSVSLYPCEYYPTPIEPGCAESSPPPSLSGPRSPYLSDGATSIWDSDPDLMVKKIKHSLAANNAVIMGFKTTVDFGAATQLYGYVNLQSSDLMVGKGGHVVHIVGYIDNATLNTNPSTKLILEGLSFLNCLFKPASECVPAGQGGGYFIIKNSWGTCKGDVGYFYMPVDYLTARATSMYVVSSESHSY